MATRVGTASDADLVAASRAGDETAAGELFNRHHAAVLGYARGLVRDQHMAEDLTSEAFARTLLALRKGLGPQEGYRPYLYTVVRNAAVDWARDGRRTVVTDEVAQWAEQPEDEDPDLDEQDALVRAYRSLPERWQTVLWHTVIEEEPVHKVAEMLGMEAGAVAQLSFRAREGLRQAFLAASCEGHPDCAEFTAQIAASVRRPGRRRGRALRQHLEVCERCRRSAEEMNDLNARLRRSLPIGLVLLSAPRVPLPPLGPVGPAFPGLAVSAGSAAVGALILGVMFTQLGDDPKRPPAAAPPAALPSATAPASPGATASAAPAVKPTKKPAAPAAEKPAKPNPQKKATTPKQATPAGAPFRVRNSTLGSCLAPDGARIVQQSCSGAATTWRRTDVAGGFTLASAANGQCLSRGAKSAGVLWEGGAAFKVTTAACNGGADQVWKLVQFQPGVTRLVNGDDGFYLQADWSGLQPPELKPSSFAGMAAQGWAVQPAG